MDTLFETFYYLVFVVCLSSLNNNPKDQVSDLGYISSDTTKHCIDTVKNDSLKAPLLLGAQQAKRLSECDTIVIYQ